MSGANGNHGFAWSLGEMVGFQKWWYPTTMGFPTKNDHFGVMFVLPNLDISQLLFVRLFFASKRSLYINIYSNSKLDIVISIIIYIYIYT